MLRWRGKWVKQVSSSPTRSPWKKSLKKHSLRTAALVTSAFVVALMSVACAPLPPQKALRGPPPTTLPVERHPSPNFDARRPNYVVIHHTTNSTVGDALRTLTDPARKVSSHYLIARDGRILQLVDDLARAWHAGESYWGGMEDLNSGSIGIELDNDGREPFAEPLIASLLTLLRDLKVRFRIPEANFIGHGDIAPGRKVDPSALFPWKRLAAEGFGLWCDPPYPAVPEAVDTALMLQAFGYDVSDLGPAIAAFKRRFVPDDPVPEMNEKDRSVLYCLVQKKMAQGR